MQTEIWKQIPGADGYEISNRGRIRNLRTGRVLKGSPNQYGHFQAQLGGCHINVARTVLRLFREEPPTPDAQARHLDGNPGNNDKDNLAWGTAKQNSADRDAHGRLPRGEAHSGSRLTAEQVYYIRGSKKSHAELARELGIHYNTVRYIRKRLAWKHI